MTQERTPVAGPGVARVEAGSFPAEGTERVTTAGARISIVSGQLKKATVTSTAGKEHEIFSDEPARLGGEDRYPEPLRYLEAAVGFCLLTQISRYAAMLKLDVDAAECVVEFDWVLSGSVLKGTVDAGARMCRVHLEVESREADEDIARLVRLAKSGCYAESAVCQPVEMRSTVVVNGRDIGFE